MYFYDHYAEGGTSFKTRSLDKHDKEILRIEGIKRKDINNYQAVEEIQQTFSGDRVVHRHYELKGGQHVK
ncbi:MAG TPA: hypothetical protein VF941_00250 [Clostridia bacterium]